MIIRLSRQYLIYVIYGVIFIYLIIPWRFAKHYDFIEKDELYNNLVRKTTRNISMLKIGVRCDYSDVIEENLFMYKRPFTEEILNNNIKLGGEYYPEDCIPSFSTAIIIPYRQRERQLNQFLIYMHNFLRRQQVRK